MFTIRHTAVRLTGKCYTASQKIGRNFTFQNKLCEKIGGILNLAEH